MPQIGEIAPDFTAKITDGTEITLSSLKGQNVVLYFYPKDNTPGCTVEACEIRDNYSEIKKYAQLFGISRDDLKSHQKFTDKHNLTFPLISDPTGEVAQKYGVWVEKSMFGKKYMGLLRATFVIDKEGKILKVWPKVNPLGHAKEILEVIRN